MVSQKGHEFDVRAHSKWLVRVFIILFVVEFCRRLTRKGLLLIVVLIKEL